MAEPLQKIIANRYGGRDLPVTLRAARRRPRAAVIDDRDRDHRADAGAALKALASPGDGRARARLRAQRHRLHRQRAARARRSPRRWSASRHGRDSRATRWRLRGWHQRRGNRANIQHHYDVSERVLPARGSTRGWSIRAPISATDGDSLDDAQAQKLDHICRKLRLAPGERFLDIGCGWGALIFWAAQHYGVEATGITLSQNQFDHVTREDRRARPRRPRAGRASSTTSTCPRTGSTTRSRASGCSSTSASRSYPTLLRQDPSDPEARRASC